MNGVSFIVSVGCVIYLSKSFFKKFIKSDSSALIGLNIWSVVLASTLFDSWSGFKISTEEGESILFSLIDSWGEEAIFDIGLPE